MTRPRTTYGRVQLTVPVLRAATMSTHIAIADVMVSALTLLMAVISYQHNGAVEAVVAALIGGPITLFMMAMAVIIRLGEKLREGK